MTRRIHRTKRFELSLLITDPEFIKPPRDAQRNWLLNRAVREFSDDLNQLDTLASRFAAGKDRGGSTHDLASADLGDQEIMEDWQIPIMERMAEIVANPSGHILEVGFGRGVSATMIQEAGVAAHTIVECNEPVISRFEEWRAQRPNADIRLIRGRWQDVVDQFGIYDGIFFHTYPLTVEEYLAYVNDSVTFAEAFFPIASSCLRPGGVLTYLSNEIDSMSRAHQRLLLNHFSEFTVSCQAIEVPDDVADAWWADSMVIVKATK